MARRLGFYGIQGLPLRGWSYRDRSLDPYIISTEGAWNYGTVGGAVKHYIGLEEHQPSFLDLILFGQSEFPFLPNAIESGHEFLDDPSQALCPYTAEIHPELSMDNEAYLHYVERGGKLCWDTHHVRRGFRNQGGPNAEPVIDWRGLLNELPRNSIQLIHVQPHSVQEEQMFLNAENTTLLAMLLALNQVAPKAPVILEIRPSANPWKNRARLRAWLNRLQAVMFVGS